ncbi:hypothetical protein KFE25_011434 [Diacronema lutheri]|uniref:SRCR domain-containing protein n=1 Tax=Diacronema lutheri TaxID=2081491 RepID=A0A8J6C501_DIALT|nr:hypothetical protein KFE25_011434 [Diacronema lutheri]
MRRVAALLLAAVGAEALRCRPGSQHSACRPAPPPPAPPASPPASGRGHRRDRSVGGKAEPRDRGPAEAAPPTEARSRARASPRFTHGVSRPGEVQPGDTPRDGASARDAHACRPGRGHTCARAPASPPMPSSPPPPVPPTHPPSPLSPPLPPAPPSPPASPPSPPSPRYEIQYADEGCGTVLALQFAASLRHCARLVGDGYFSYSAATHYCFTCTQTQVRRRIPHTGYNVYNTSYSPPPPTPPPSPPPPPPPPVINFGDCAAPSTGDVQFSANRAHAMVVLNVYDVDRWGTVCAPLADGDVDAAASLSGAAQPRLASQAAVACRQLGFDGSEQPRLAVAEDPDGKPLAHDIECKGGELSLHDCVRRVTRPGAHCTSKTVLAVECTGEARARKRWCDEPDSFVGSIHMQLRETAELAAGDVRRRTAPAAAAACGAFLLVAAAFALPALASALAGRARHARAAQASGASAQNARRRGFERGRRQSRAAERDPITVGERRRRSSEPPGLALV